MDAVLPFRWWAYQGREEPEEKDLAIPETEEQESEDRQICCFLCYHPITTTHQRISRQGGHEHSFSNPEGYLFKIGCFRKAPGCIKAGAFTEAFSWFRGYAWRYALCSNCRAHLGWEYQSSREDEFHGLILERLIIDEQ